MKKNLCIILFTIFSLNISAQNTQQLSKDPKAKKILDQLSKKTKSYKTLSIKFTYSLENQQNKSSEKLNGEAFLKGKKYKLILPGNEIFSDGKTVWNYIKDANEINISKPDSSDESISNPSKLFTMYEKGYKYQLIEQAKDNSSSTIDLFPEKPKTKKISRVRMKIDMNKMRITSIKIFNKDGNQNTVEVTEFKADTDIPDNLFVFDPKKYPKNIDIIDTRDE